MSSFFSFLPAGGWQRLMCDVLWQSTLIAAAGLARGAVSGAPIGRAGVGAVDRANRLCRGAASEPRRAIGRLDDARRERTIRGEFG